MQGGQPGGGGRDHRRWRPGTAGANRASTTRAGGFMGKATSTAASPGRTLPVPVRGDLEIVGEDDRPGGEFGLVDLLELPHGGGGAVGLVGRLIGELEEVDE